MGGNEGYMICGSATPAAVTVSAVDISHLKILVNDHDFL
jgi:hypothetical protein